MLSKSGMFAGTHCSTFVCPGPCSSRRDDALSCSKPSVSLRKSVSHVANWQMTTTAPRRKAVADAGGSALSAGIKAVAVGKFGNKSVSEELAERIKDELRFLEDGDHSNETLFLQRSSFLGSLFAKANLEPQEQALLGICRRNFTSEYLNGIDRGPNSCTAGELIAYITESEDSPDSITRGLIHYALKLLNGKRLDEKEAQELGDLLFTTNNNRSMLSVKCLIAHVMRVRHESCAELIGLARAARSTLNPSFKMDQSSPSPLQSKPVQRTALIAEPFDGVTKSSLLTPLIANYLQTHQNYLPLLSCGDTPGPKYGTNLKTLSEALEIPTITNLNMLTTPLNTHPFGLTMDQTTISSGLSSWIPIRRAIIKRPGLATVEKFADIVPGEGSELFIASAFHASYVDRMIAVAEAVGFRKYVIVQKGQEGTLGLRVSAKTKAMVNVGVKKMDGYERLAFEWGIEDAGIDLEEVSRKMKEDGEMGQDLGDAGCAGNEDLVKKHLENGESGCAEFDARVQLTLGMVKHAIECIESI